MEELQTEQGGDEKVLRDEKEEGKKLTQADVIAMKTKFRFKHSAKVKQC